MYENKRPLELLKDRDPNLQIKVASYRTNGKGGRFIYEGLQDPKLINYETIYSSDSATSGTKKDVEKNIQARVLRNYLRSKGYHGYHTHEMSRIKEYVDDHKLRILTKEKELEALDVDEELTDIGKSRKKQKILGYIDREMKEVAKYDAYCEFAESKEFLEEVERQLEEKYLVEPCVILSLKEGWEA